MAAWRGQDGAGAVHDRPLVVSQHSSLPEWLVSALSQISGEGIQVRNNVQCSVEIRHTLPVQGLEVHYVRPTFCVKALTEEDRLRVHEHNGTHVAYHGTSVFMTCIVGSHRIGSFKEGYKVVNRSSKVSEDGEVEAVGAISTRHVHWLMLSKEEVEMLAERGEWLYLVMYCLSIALV